MTAWEVVSKVGSGAVQGVGFWTCGRWMGELGARLYFRVQRKRAVRSFDEVRLATEHALRVQRAELDGLKARVQGRSVSS